jgi:hypothetical protein
MLENAVTGLDTWIEAPRIMDFPWMGGDQKPFYSSVMKNRRDLEMSLVRFIQLEALI